MYRYFPIAGVRRFIISKPDTDFADDVTNRLVYISKNSNPGHNIGNLSTKRKRIHADLCKKIQCNKFKNMPANAIFSGMPAQSIRKI